MPCPIAFCQSLKCAQVRKVACGVVGALVLFKAVSAVNAMRAAKKNAALNANNQQNVVYIHAAPPLENAVSLGAPAVKVIGFMKLHKIPHVIRYTMDASGSPNGLMPYMVLNGTATSESEVMLDVIAKHFNVDETAGLSAEELATGHLVRIAVEEHIRFCVYRCTMVDNFNVMLNAFRAIAPPLPGPLLRMALGRYRKSAIETLDRQGNGMLTDERYQAEFVATIKTLETVLGSKKYFTSNSKVTRYDLAAFAWLEQAIRHAEISAPGPNYIRQSATIMSFLKRIREQVFPDAAAIVSAFKTQPVQSFISA